MVLPILMGSLIMVVVIGLSMLLLFGSGAPKILGKLLEPVSDCVTAVLPEKWVSSVPQTPLKFKLTPVSDTELRVSFRSNVKGVNPFHRERYLIELAEEVDDEVDETEEQEQDGEHADGNAATSASNLKARSILANESGHTGIAKADVKAVNSEGNGSCGGNTKNPKKEFWRSLGSIEKIDESFIIDNLPPGFHGRFRLSAHNGKGRSAPTAVTVGKAYTPASEENGAYGPTGFTGLSDTTYTTYTTYTWGQTKETIWVKIPIPDNIRGKDIAAKVKPGEINVTFVKESATRLGYPEKLLCGTLFDKCIPDDFTWQIDAEEDGERRGQRFFYCQMAKRTIGEKWSCLVKGHPEVDAKKIVFDKRWLDKVNLANI